MLERINLLKSEIDRLRKLAASSDDDIAAQFLSLISEMQTLVAQLEHDAKAVVERNA